MSYVRTGTMLENPCTLEAMENGQFYHAYPLDDHSYVHCDESGFPHVRPCPASLVWSVDYLTCVRRSAAKATRTTTTTTASVADKDWWKYVLAGSVSQQQQQQQDDGSVQDSWQSAGAAQEPWTRDTGSPTNNMQQWMMMMVRAYIGVRAWAYIDHGRTEDDSARIWCADDNANCPSQTFKKMPLRIYQTRHFGRIFFSPDGA